MTNHRSCCCGECDSPSRRFVRCYDDELHNPHLIRLVDFDDLNLSEGEIYLFDSPECGSFCGYFICDPAYPEGYDDWCLPGPLGNCSNCDADTNPYLLRPSDLDPNPFELLEDLGDEFNTGDCCDWRCPNRISAICDENPSFCDDGFKVRGCVCTDVDDLDVLIDVDISGPSEQTFDMVFDWYDCSGNFNFEQPGPSWTTRIVWSYLGAVLVSTEYCVDGVTPRSRIYRMDFNASRTLSCPTPPTCPPCQNGGALVRCSGGNPQTAACGAVGTHDLANSWPVWTDDLRYCKWFRISVTDTSTFGNDAFPAKFEWVPQPFGDPFNPYDASNIVNPCYEPGRHAPYTYGHNAGFNWDIGWDPASDGELRACAGTNTVGRYWKQLVLKPSTACLSFNSFCVPYAAPSVPELPGPRIDVTVGFGLGPVPQEPDPC